MAKYILLLNWTDQGVRSVKDSPKRLDAGRELGKKHGITVGDAFMTMGAYDMSILVDAPDDETLARFSLTLAMQGNVRTTTLKAFDEATYRKVIGSL